jgi:FecR protein
MASLPRAFPILLLGLFVAGCLSVPAYADTSHARIVRLSTVQGDVRFARDVKGDPLSDSSQLSWETAALNLPIRQGYVVATDNGRVEVEFENGALAFLAENTVLQFYDLSSEDGGLTTRLILRQGSAEFYVNPARGDYFSVTGGDFSVEAESKATFRMNNFDDGSNVSVLHGHVTALANGKSTNLSKDEEFSMRAGDAESVEVAHRGDNDEFDQWAASRVSTSLAATNASMQYTNGTDYVSGFGDLYTYGSWFPAAGYGYCWRPYGVGFGWSPFDNGSWYYDPFFGWSFLGGYSWGWLPYHYGGWLFQPGVGWAWSPRGTRGGPGLGKWQPVTGVWMRGSNGNMGIVPAHPMDVRGKTPLNLSQGLFAVSTRGVTGQITPQSDAKWKVENKPGRDVIQNQLASTSAPARVSRTMVASTGGAGGRGAAGAAGSTIVFDRNEGRFVNSTNARVGESTQATAGTAAEANKGNAGQAQGGTKVFPAQGRSGNDARVPPAGDRMNAREGQGRQVPPAARNTPPPPSVPRAVTNERVFNQNNAGQGGGRVTGPAAAGASGRSAGGTPSRGSSPSGGASSGGARSSGGSTGGGRPH